MQYISQSKIGFEEAFKKILNTKMPINKKKNAAKDADKIFLGDRFIFYNLKSF